jgi:outer membrane protein assembly factor BamB
VLGGTLFFGGTDGNVYGVEPAKSLETAYQTGLAGSQVIAAPAAADGALFVAATNGVLYALNIGGAAPDAR